MPAIIVRANVTYIMDRSYYY